MIDGIWFLEHINDKQDLMNYSTTNILTPEEYKQLKINSSDYLLKKNEEMRRWNKKIARILYRICYDIIERMEAIENEQ